MEGQFVRPTSYVATVTSHRAVCDDMSPLALARYFGELRGLDERQAAAKVVVEHVFERVRMQIDARLPSRLSCIYVCQGADVAILWNRELPGTVVYTCEVVGWWAQVDANKIGEARARLDPDQPSPDAVESALLEMERVAKTYWNHEMGNPFLPELLISGAARIVTRMDPVALPSPNRFSD